MRTCELHHWRHMNTILNSHLAFWASSIEAVEFTSELKAKFRDPALLAEAEENSSKSAAIMPRDA